MFGLSKTLLSRVMWGVVFLGAALVGGCDSHEADQPSRQQQVDSDLAQVKAPLIIDHEAILHFQSDWNVRASNLPILAGGRLRVDYDSARLSQCRATYNGLPTWGITIHYRALPDQTIRRASLPVHGNVLRTVFAVPEGTEELELWFVNTDRHGCRAEDSRFGENYRYKVTHPSQMVDMVFPASWDNQAVGIPRQNGIIRVDYAPERLRTCRATYNGGRAWNLFASWRFLPGGQSDTVSLYEGDYFSGEAGILKPMIPVPPDATAVEFWFSNSDRSGCMAWDSNFGDNHRFPILPGQQGEHPQVGWVGSFDFILVRAQGVESLGDVDPAYYWYQTMPGARNSSKVAVKGWIPGITDQHYGSHEDARAAAEGGVKAQFLTNAFPGDGPDGWAVLQPVFVGKQGNNFVYEYNFASLAPGQQLQAGLYGYFFRFSTDNGITWTHAGKDQNHTRRLVLAPSLDCSLFPDHLPPQCPQVREVGWAGSWGGYFGRSCEYRQGIPDPVVYTKSSAGHDCMMLSAEVWIDGVTDRQGDSAVILAQVETDLGFGGGPLGELTTHALVFDTRSGNNYRYVWYLGEHVGRAQRGDYRFRFRFSADQGLTWTTIGAGDGAGTGFRQLHIRNDSGDLDNQEQCDGIGQWAGPTTHFNHCIDYRVDGNRDVEDCEFYVNALGRGNFSHNGASASWLEAYLRVLPHAGEVLNAGILVNYTDEDGSSHTAYSMGREIEPHYWATGFTFAQSSPQAYGPRFSYQVQDFAFFLDVRLSSGLVDRLWNSGGGTNYTPGEAYAVAGYIHGIGSGSIEYADESVRLFDGKRRCSQ